MYSACDYPYKSYLCTFWPCHPYLLTFTSVSEVIVQKPSSFIFSQAFSSMATAYTHSLMDATPATHTCFVYRLPYTVQFLNFELSRKIVSNINRIEGWMAKPRSTQTNFVGIIT